MKRTYIVYTTIFAVVSGLILCVLLVFSKPETLAQIQETFAKIETQSKHQAAVKQVPPKTPSSIPNPEEPLIKNVQQMLYDDSIGSYLVVTEDYRFFEISGTGERINASFQIEDEGKLMLSGLDGMTLVDGETVALLTSNQILVTVKREDGVWKEDKREKIAGTTIRDSFHGLGYDMKEKQFYTINHIRSLERSELAYFMTKQDELKIDPDATAKEKRALKKKQKPPYLTIVARKRIDTASAMRSDAKKAFTENFRPIGLAERQGRIYTLDSEALYLYSIDTKDVTITGESASPKVYGAEGIFVQDNELFALIETDKFSSRSFTPID
ncbi:hypothetical protein QK289_00335 [Exiguobacterium antarcticum]|uniref:DUF4340 domain-containing protein n=1 Tax=Exiguobacterium antarcticum TaxID=132920 RepID=A0ABT6QXL7_9BACL|nr:hypothetical protein [Exiguobacterium antarcticum]MDI3233435.1 hypothetical protein [Exiguobacterium antarcticum]